jgi:hypothetical protein
MADPNAKPDTRRENDIPPPSNTPQPKGVTPKIGEEGDASGAADPDFSTGVDTGAIQPGKSGGATSQ